MKLSEFVSYVDSLPKDRRQIIALDGGSGSGKSTVARGLYEIFGFSVFHTDDYFLPPEMRTESRLSEAGGNFHRERFLSEILLPLSKGEPISYRPFDCKASALQPAKEVVPTAVSIVEGSYSLHPELEKYYSLKCFLNISKDCQRERILLRNGDGAVRFFERWIPLEDRYFEATDIKKRADIVIDIPDIT